MDFWKEYDQLSQDLRDGLIDEGTYKLLMDVVIRLHLNAKMDMKTLLKRIEELQEVYYDY